MRGCGRVLTLQLARCTQAPTYVPRLLLLDVGGALGGVACAADGEAFAGGGDAPPVVATWGGATHVVRREAVPKSGFVRALEAEAAADDDSAAAARGEAHSSDGDDDGDGDARRGGGAAAAGGEAHEAPGAPERDSEGGGEVERAGAALEGSVAYWSDYAKALLHPHSTLLLPGVWHGVHAFDGYGDSRDFVGGDTGEAARDRLRRAPRLRIAPARACTHVVAHVCSPAAAAWKTNRYFAEECDSLGGFQLLAHDAGGFGAMTEGLMAHIRDEYPRSPVVRPARRARERLCFPGGC